MKTTMKITGNISLILISLGTVAKIFHWPAAGIALSAGFILLCFIFFPSAIFLNHSEQKKETPILLHISILIGGILFMLGVLFKVMHWPTSAILLFSGWMIILFLFLPILLFIKVKGAQSSSEKWTYTIGVFSLIVFEMAAMFKMFHWPGASILLILGSVMLVSVFIPRFSWSQFKESNVISPQYIFIIIISAYAVILTALLSLNVSGNLLTSFSNDERDAGIISKYYQEKNDLVMADDLQESDSTRLLKEMQAASIREETNNLNAFIYSIKSDLIGSAEGVDEKRTAYLMSHPEEIIALDHADAVKKLNTLTKGKRVSIELKMKINLYKEKMITIALADKSLSTKLEAILNTSDVLFNNEKKAWEGIQFENALLGSVLSVLKETEVQVRMAEAETLAYIQKTN